MNLRKQQEEWIVNNLYETIFFRRSYQIYAIGQNFNKKFSTLYYSDNLFLYMINKGLFCLFDPPFYRVSTPIDIAKWRIEKIII